eukprot:TRINITY_DN38163_c0_g1_i1.p1 TRINITY_DN38163_c0_g1~~TRINITY_DN38163_c0_g1_i1.p1  ORF type:complete len:881 (+),score=119.53 TRINITY_DN38163_c0_g1_i1:120-2762(+)
MYSPRAVVSSPQSRVSVATASPTFFMNGYQGQQAQLLGPPNGTSASRPMRSDSTITASPSGQYRNSFLEGLSPYVPVVNRSLSVDNAGIRRSSVSSLSSAAGLMDRATSPRPATIMQEAPQLPRFGVEHVSNTLSPRSDLQNLALQQVSSATAPMSSFGPPKGLEPKKGTVESIIRDFKSAMTRDQVKNRDFCDFSQPLYPVNSRQMSCNASTVGGSVTTGVGMLSVRSPRMSSPTRILGEASTRSLKAAVMSAVGSNSHRSLLPSHSRRIPDSPSVASRSESVGGGSSLKSLQQYRAASQRTLYEQLQASSLTHTPKGSLRAVRGHRSPRRANESVNSSKASARGRETETAGTPRQPSPLHSPRSDRSVSPPESPPYRSTTPNSSMLDALNGSISSTNSVANSKAYSESITGSIRKDSKGAYHSIHTSRKHEKELIPASPATEKSETTELSTPLKVQVNVVSAPGIHRMNFNNDAPWCRCEIVHLGDTSQDASQVEMQAVKGSRPPTWNDTVELENWFEGDSIQFTVFDRGSVGLRVEGKWVLKSHEFYPSGFDGLVQASGVADSKLHVRIMPMQASVRGTASPKSSARVRDTLVGKAPGSKRLSVPLASTSPPGKTADASSSSKQGVRIRPPQVGSSKGAVASNSSGNKTANKGKRLGGVSARANGTAGSGTPEGGTPEGSDVAGGGVSSSALSHAQALAAAAAAAVKANADSMHQRTPPPAQHPVAADVAAGTASAGTMAERNTTSRAFEAGPCNKLSVTFIRATDLERKNFLGDAPWCAVEVKHTNKVDRQARCETKAISSTLNPEWNETHELEPWSVGEPLEFTVYDQGAIGSKVEGFAAVPSSKFYPHGFEGIIPLSGLKDATLTVRIEPKADS